MHFGNRIVPMSLKPAWVFSSEQIKGFKYAFEEVLAVPFLHRYCSLLSHVHYVATALFKKMDGLAKEK